MSEEKSMKICTVITIALLHFLKAVDSHPQSQYRRQSMHHWESCNKLFANAKTNFYILLL